MNDKMGPAKRFAEWSHSVALRLMPRVTYASVFKDTAMVGDIFPLVQVSPNRLPLAHSQQAEIALSSAAAASVCRS